MTRYHELCALAEQYSRQFYEHRVACVRTARILIQAYADYLDCPLNQISQIRLGTKLERTEETASIDAELPLFVDPDGFWGFCWRIDFDRGHVPLAAHEFVAIALKIEGSILTIKGDCVFRTSVDDVATWRPFFDHLFVQSKVGFAKPYGQRSNQIGFVERY